MQYFYELYSALNLTHFSDRPYAIAGLEQRIARAFESATDHGVLWRWPERMLLWRAELPGSLTRIDYHRREPSQPSWSWMAYKGRITFSDVFSSEVEWTGMPQSPTVELYLDVSASRLRIDGRELMERAELDMQGVDFDEELWRFVSMGKKRASGEADDATHYGLLIRHISASGRSRDLYERVGVATLLASHLSVETDFVFVV